ncbi:androgen-induced gene 1 protein isoform X4 [Carettochelys insculpta]|uniref:androgen-induced gene 1 protein isoform X4 n=1 Tax=Carettochelys insculpta TaxID=44489 RepID=UPI003EBFF7D8
MALVPCQVLRVAILLSYFSILCTYKAIDMPAHQTYGGSWKFLTFINLEAGPPIVVLDTAVADTEPEMATEGKEHPGPAARTRHPGTARRLNPTMDDDGLSEGALVMNITSGPSIQAPSTCGSPDFPKGPIAPAASSQTSPATKGEGSDPDPKQGGEEEAGDAAHTAVLQDLTGVLRE